MLPLISASMTSVSFTVEGILAYRKTAKNQIMYLTRWKGSKDLTWEPRSNFVNGWDEIIRGMSFMPKKAMVPRAIYSFDETGESEVLFMNKANDPDHIPPSFSDMKMYIPQPIGALLSPDPDVLINVSEIDTRPVQAAGVEIPQENSSIDPVPTDIVHTDVTSGMHDADSVQPFANDESADSMSAEKESAIIDNYVPSSSSSSSTSIADDYDIQMSESHSQTTESESTSSTPDLVSHEIQLTATPLPDVNAILSPHMGIIQDKKDLRTSKLVRIAASLNADAGWGVFASKNLKAGTKIPIYGQIHWACCSVFKKCRVEQTVLIPPSHNIPPITFAMCRSGYGYYVNHYNGITDRANCR